MCAGIKGRKEFCSTYLLEDCYYGCATQVRLGWVGLGWRGLKMYPLRQWVPRRTSTVSSSYFGRRQDEMRWDGMGWRVWMDGWLIWFEGGKLSR